MSQINYHLDGDLCRVVLPERFIAPLVPEMKTRLLQLLADGVTTLEFDLSATEVIDSSAIGLLTAVSNSLAKQDGRMTVVQVSAQILRLLTMMRLVDRLNISGRTA